VKVSPYLRLLGRSRIVSFLGKDETKLEECRVSWGDVRILYLSSQVGLSMGSPLLRDKSIPTTKNGQITLSWSHGVLCDESEDQLH
jgi:hypothetical protein